MDIHSHRIDTPPIPSASVILLRDHEEEGVQVLLMQRHQASAVLGGAHVFPGGKLDAADCERAAWSAWGLDPLRCQQQLAEPDLDAANAAGLFVAALRELQEEAGIVLKAGDVLPWSRWITPRIASISTKRFDTRFFVAVQPQGQEAQHDAHETTETIWLSPFQAVQRYAQRHIDLAPPQIMTLVQLHERSEDVRAALPAQTARGPVSALDVWATAQSVSPCCIEPAPQGSTEARVICYPGDPEHPLPQAYWRGPSRLYWRRGCFEPHAGWDEWMETVKRGGS